MSRWRRRIRRAAWGLLLLAVLWAGTAYLLLPFAFRHFEHQAGVSALEMVTRTKEGFAGDPINIGVVGTREELVALLHAAGWFPADPVTLRTSLDIIGSVALDRPYPDAPVSSLFYLGRPQDLAFEKAVGVSADRRQHVRLWQVLEKGREGRPVWLAAATLDTGVGLSHYTGAVTHAIAPDVDTMRDRLSAELAATGRISETYEVSGVGPTLAGRNGEGDRYWTDGEVRFSVVAAPGTQGSDPPLTLDKPFAVSLKDAIWPYLAGAGSALPGA